MQSELSLSMFWCQVLQLCHWSMIRVWWIYDVWPFAYPMCLIDLDCGSMYPKFHKVNTRHSKYGISNEWVLNKNVCQAHACSIWSWMQCSAIFERQRHNKITFQGLHVKETLWADASSHIAAANDCHRLPTFYWEQVPSANVSLKTEPWEIQLLLFQEQWGKIHFWNIENTYQHINYKKHSDLIWSSVKSWIVKMKSIETFLSPCLLQTPWYLVATSWSFNSFNRNSFKYNAVINTESFAGHFWIVEVSYSFH